MLCPIDHSTLVLTPFGGKNLHRCNQCSGSFVTADTFSEVRAATAMQLHTRSKSGYLHVQRSDGQTLNCPCHDQAMQTIFFKGVEIDVCFECKGIWLDQDELQKISELAQVAKLENLSEIPQEKARDVGKSKGGSAFDGGLDVMGLISEIVSYFD